MYSIIFSTLLLNSNINNDVINKIRLQNQNVVQIAAKSLSKNLPQQVDEITSLVKIIPNQENLTYIFEINSTKSDEELIKQDKSTFKKRIIDGICSSSKRFLQSNISITYIYQSSKSKQKLFRVDVDHTTCNYPPK